MADDTYPRMLYRAAEAPNPEAWNLPLATLIVESRDDEAEAVEAGWSVDADAALIAPEPAREPSILDQSAAKILEALAGLTPDEVSALLEAEKAGKTRKGVIAALEADIAAKTGT